MLRSVSRFTYAMSARWLICAGLMLASCDHPNRVCDQQSGACLALRADGWIDAQVLSIQLSDFAGHLLASYITDPIPSPSVVEVPATRVDGPLTVRNVRCLSLAVSGQKLSARKPLIWQESDHISEIVGVQPPANLQFQRFEIRVPSAQASAVLETVATADIDQDGHLDLVVANSDSAQKSAFVLHGVGNGTWREELLSAPTRPRGVTISDLNGDGLLDIVTGAEESNDTPVLVSLRQQNGSFGALTPLLGTDGSQPISIAAVDLDHDQLNDLAIVYSGDASLRLFKNTSTPKQSPVRVQLTMTLNTGGPQSVQASAVEFNGDGNVDLVLTRLADTSNFITMKNNGDFKFDMQKLDLPVRPALFAIADVDQDRRSDLILTNNSKISGIGFGQVQVFLGKSQPWKPEAPAIQTETSFARAVAVADFNGDQLPDLAVVGYGSSRLSILLGDGKGGFELQSSPQVDVGCAHPLALISGDFNEDCRPDLVVACENGKSLSLLTNNSAI